MWEAASDFHRSLGRQSPASARSALISEPSVLQVVAGSISGGPFSTPPRTYASSQHSPLSRSYASHLASISPPSRPYTSTSRSTDPRWTAFARPCTTMKVRCVDAGGIAYRRSRNLLDVISSVEAPPAIFCEEVLVYERHDNWVLAAKGWLPLEFNGKVRFLLLETTDVEMQQVELERARSECNAAWAEAMTLRQELEDSRAECADKTHKLTSVSRHLNDVSLGLKSPPAIDRACLDSQSVVHEPDVVARVIAEATAPADDAGKPRRVPEFVCEDARRQIDEYVRQQALVPKHSYVMWPRVRLPIRIEFVDQSGAQWFMELRRTLVAIVELKVSMRQLEVIAVRSGAEEMEAFESLPRVRCSPHHSAVGAAVDREALIPAVGTSKRISWYSELTCIKDPFLVVDLALAPEVNASNFARVLCQRLAHREGHALSQKDVGTAALSYIVPRSVSRVYVWPAESASGELLVQKREMLRDDLR